MPYARLLLLLPLLVLPSCDLGPDYGRPALEIPAAFRATAVSASQAWPPSEWWHAFGSAELDGLIADAQAHNQDLAAAAARVVQADATVRINGAPLLPTVSATGNASYSRTGSSRSGSVSGVTTGGGGVTTTTNTGNGTTTSTTNTTGSTVVSGASSRTSHYSDSRQYSLQASVSYEVDFWGKNRAAYESAQASALASRFDQQTVALTVVTSVATTYFQALGTADRLAVAKRNLADARSSLKVFQVRVQVGTATALDVAQEEALVAGQAAQIPLLQSTLDQQIIGLGILVGRPPETIHITADTLNTLPIPAIGAGLPSELLARRPDIANAEANLLAQNGNVRSARAAFFPSLTLTSQGGIESLALSTILGPGNLAFTAASSLTQTIFDNGLKQGDLDVAKGRFAELIATYRQAVLQAFTDVDLALTTVRYTGEQEDLVREAVRVAQLASDIAKAQLAAGTVDITTVLNTQTTLYGDQDTLASVRLTHFQALINLYKALGGGFTSASVPGTP
jgi:NodT family efflux transporter outer membrane factor (OMF) lipoprotein